jgi:2-dehydro-3-deoxyphosphogluconate aldolase / (4S)-4-hydroxy-2-oxoglutarate aldolase
MSKPQLMDGVMSKKQYSLEAILQQGVLPLYFHANAEVSVNVLKALYAAGIRAVEYTNRGKEALQNFKVLVTVRDSNFKDMQLGIGTIKNELDAKYFIDAGADFIISPGMIPDVAKEVDKAQLLWIPGCMTVSEIIQAEALGAKFVKIFPGNLLGPAFVSSIKDIFPQMCFMPTGGVELNEENMNAWFKSGVVAVGLGSKLISKELLDQKNYSAIEKSTKEAISIVQRIKK